MLCKRKGFDIVSASEMNCNRKVSMQQPANLTWEKLHLPVLYWYFTRERFRFLIPVVFYVNVGGWVSQNITFVGSYFYWMTMTTCFGRSLPSSGQTNLITKVRNIHIHMYMRQASWCSKRSRCYRPFSTKVTG